MKTIKLSELEQSVRANNDKHKEVIDKFEHECRSRELEEEEYNNAKVSEAFSRIREIIQMTMKEKGLTEEDIRKCLPERYRRKLNRANKRWWVVFTIFYKL